MNIYRVEDILTRYPDTQRRGIVVNDPYISRNNDYIGTYTGDFLADYQKLYDASQKSNLITTQHNENATFADMVYGVKNGYLSFGF
jgi:purine nucleoside permease